MPIRWQDRDRYPPDWDEISARIRLVRSGGRCECHGECGTEHDVEAVSETLAYEPGRCEALNRAPHPVTGSGVVLTTAHLNHTPEDCRDENLRAMCQRCHLRHDAPHHAATRAATRAAQLATTMNPLFQEGT
jgi:hypothetical protein